MGGVDGRHLAVRREALEDYELVISPTYYGKRLVGENKWQGSSIPTRSRYATTEAVIKFLQGGISDALRDSPYVLSVMKLMFLIMIPKK